LSALSLPWDEQPGQPNNINHVMENDEALRDKFNGNIDADNLTPAEAVKLGLSTAAIVRRGVTVIVTEETRTNVAYGTLTTPDQVASVVVPTNGRIRIGYSALWKESVLNAARAAIFLGAVQLKVPQANGAPVVQEAATSASSGDDYVSLSSSAIGLASQGGGAALTVDSSFVTTGQLLTGVAELWAAAGTYTISVQFKASSGTVSVKQRQLWVETLGY
jgi:hypothetical protein